MLVQEFIEELKKLPQDATVNIWPNDSAHCNAIDPVKFDTHTWNGEVFADITCA